MSVENEGQFLASEQVEMMRETPKKPQISYTRDFLLSLSELDVCKKLPSGFDPAILGDFGVASNSVTEWQRPLDGLSSQSFRRGEYGSSPPSRGESNNYSRGGRWDTRSSGSNDRDGESQSDKDSDSGRRFGNQPRRPWQNPEHDGLLGSGVFPRPSGFTAAPSAPKGRGNGTYQLSRSTEPYHPPRPYKVVPHSRREFTDSINDETFGSSECSSQDREEEERKRRASFELFRKESQKEKKNQFPNKNGENCDDPDIAALLKDSENSFCNESNGTEDIAPPASQSESAISAPTPASRPLVPPGFRTSILEKNLVTKPLVPHPSSEVGNIELQDKFNRISDNQDVKSAAICVNSVVQKCGSKTVQTPFAKFSEKITRPSDVKDSEDLVGVGRPSSESSNPPQQVYKAQRGDGVAQFDNEKTPVRENMGETGQVHTGSILDKLFGSAATNNDVKADDTESQIPYQSSKFSLWFGEEKKPSEDLSSGQPKDLLSLIVSAEKGRSCLSEVSDEKPMEVHPSFPFKSNEPLHGFLCSTETTAAVGIHDPPYHSNNQEATPQVLTCEDLEQSILSEINNSSFYSPPPVQLWGTMDPKANQPKPEVNNLASQHILSLLQKGTSMNDSVPSSTPDVQSADNINFYEGSIGTVDNSSQGGSEVQNTAKNPTLETFFGTSFMKELQSVQAPVSAQRGSIGGPTRTEFPGPHGFPFPVPDAGFVPSDVNEYGSNKNTLADDIPRSNHLQQTKSSKTENRLLGFDVHRNEVGFNLSAFGSRPDRGGEIQLPGEESLFRLGDAMNPLNPAFMHVKNATKADLRSSSNVSFDIADNLAALNASLKDERSMIMGADGPPPFSRGLYNPLEPEISYQNMRGQQSSPPFSHLQINHGRPPMQPLDSHAHMGPESIINHGQPQHQFPANVIHHPSHQHVPGVPTRFDSAAQNHMLPQMQVPNFSLPQLLQGHPGGAPLPPHLLNHFAGHIPEEDPIQAFRFHRQPGYGGHGIPMPAPGVGGSNHTDAFGKLMEMELRANAKQVHPLDGSGLYNEADMRLRYR